MGLVAQTFSRDIPDIRCFKVSPTLDGGAVSGNRVLLILNYRVSSF